MSEDERFTAFLRNAAATVREPPATPREEMWREIEAALAVAADGPPQWVAGDEELAGVTASYHAPPAPPHDDMWSRVEAAWELRRSVPPRAREAGLDALPDRPPGDAAAERPTARRRAIAATGAVLALAASLVIGIAIGRGSIGAFGGQDGARRTAANEGAASGLTLADGPGAATASADDPGDAGSRSIDLGPDPGTNDVIETLESARPPATRLASADEAPARSTRDVAIGYATAKHLGQAETLLTSFRADSGVDDGSTGDLGGTVALSEWARVLLADTRLLLDLPVKRSEAERALLEDLELVLAQVARLGPGAPAFERDLIAESIEREGTIARLRAAAPPGASATSTGT